MTMPSATPRRGLLYSLGRWRWLHQMVQGLGIYSAANWVLKHLPRTRRLAHSGARLRIHSVAGLALAEEMLDGGAYACLARIGPVATFIDLGCNAGWFPCLLREHGSATPVGLLIDADPAMVEEARWHMTANAIDARCLWGAVGAASRGTVATTTFHVNPANTASSLAPFTSDHPFPVKGRVRTIAVPALTVADEWRRLFGDRVIDVMKVDVEGAEFAFLRQEGPFITAAVRYVICEWHAWHGSVADLRVIIEPLGFVLVEVGQEDVNGGVALFRNTHYVPDG
jgi:FkbM family methyltransferase